MSINLNDIPLDCGHNLGGIHYLRINPVYNVKSIPGSVAHVIQQPIQLYDPQHYADIWFVTGGFTEVMTDEANGEYFKQAIQVYVPKDAPDLAFAIQELTGVRCICQYVDGNKNAKLVGSLEAPLTFSSELDTGSDFSDKNGYKLSFKTDSIHKAFFYLMYEGDTPPPRKAFSSGFSYGFLRS
ncbi:hypothetical protein [Xanthocytophaga flava]|uniref:hypothetical protein n=1 Tax=Xanthocytophaga flava TaxID=3048013 RepID=UPI0028D3331D|nr:hypothetical protein [Xanthocytophaga flavus]MDJ1468177.1 hypothetical protein [Xanthocytophaga flavus]